MFSIIFIIIIKSTMIETVVQGPMDVVLVGGLNNFLLKQSLSQVKKEIDDMEVAMKKAHLDSNLIVSLLLFPAGPASLEASPEKDG